MVSHCGIVSRGWAHGSFVEAKTEVKEERQRRGKAAMSLTKAEAESSRPWRGTVKSTLFVSF